MTLKDDIETVRAALKRDEEETTWEQVDLRQAAERVLSAAERSANPALQALLDACEAVPLAPFAGRVLFKNGADVSDLAQAIAHWRAAKAEGFVPAAERSGRPTPPRRGGGGRRRMRVYVLPGVGRRGRRVLPVPADVCELWASLGRAALPARRLSEPLPDVWRAPGARGSGA